MPARPIIRVTPLRFAVASRWSKSMAHDGNRPPQSWQGTFRTASRIAACARHRRRLRSVAGSLDRSVAARPSAHRRCVRTRWQFAHTTSHLATSVASRAGEASMPVPDVSREEPTGAVVARAEPDQAERHRPRLLARSDPLDLGFAVFCVVPRVRCLLIPSDHGKEWNEWSVSCSPGPLRRVRAHAAFAQMPRGGNGAPRGACSRSMHRRLGSSWALICKEMVHAHVHRPARLDAA